MSTRVPAFEYTDFLAPPGQSLVWEAVRWDGGALAVISPQPCLCSLHAPVTHVQRDYAIVRSSSASPSVLTSASHSFATSYS